MDNFGLRVLIILDGWGIAPPGPGNAITQAKTPFMNKAWLSCPHGYLHASGSSVGLPHGVNGNSEVGHMNIGAGKVVYQDLPRINTAIENKTFFQNDKIIAAINHAKLNDGRVHIFGLVSTGKVHSDIDHIYSILQICSQHKIEKNNVLIHAFTDGRDTDPFSARMFIEGLQSEMERLNIGRFASICGRFYGMDRDNRWDRTEKAYRMIAEGQGHQTHNIFEAITESYGKNISDEFIEPYIILDEEGKLPGNIKSGDSVLCTNFRSDRVIQITESFVNPNFTIFKRQIIDNLFFVTLTEYKKGLSVQVAFPPEKIISPIGKVVADLGLKQLRISESEKFPHITYFLNGGTQAIFEGEDRIEIPSPHVATYDLKPEMSAVELTKKLINIIDTDKYKFIVINYANPDMVAHTGEIPSTIKAIETVDKCLSKLIPVIIRQNGQIFITADHGNAEELINLRTGQRDTEHSTNPVPFIYLKKGGTSRELQFGILADIAPTILKTWGIEKQIRMTGRSLI